jgi:hypothetical protein
VAKLPGVIFGILTICGVIFVLAADGRVNAGYAVIPMIFYLAFVALLQNKRKDN